jgi:hypothetical protein
MALQRCHWSVTSGAGTPAHIPLSTESTCPTCANPVTCGWTSAAGAMPMVGAGVASATARSAPTGLNDFAGVRSVKGSLPCPRFQRAHERP